MTKRVIIEADKRLSESLIWEIQRRYFAVAGVEAWGEDVVPHQISCNPFMAAAYGEGILGYLRDCVAAGLVSEEQPIYIVELGAGSGRLTYHLLHQFYPRFLASPFGHLPVQFVLTDFAPAVVKFWQGHEKLRPWVEQGLLDFALFDVGGMRPLELVESGKRLPPAEMKNPTILLANYFFDSIPQDSFVIEDGELQQNLLTLYSTQKEIDLSDPAIWERLTLAYEALPLPEPLYDFEEEHQLLAWYEEVLPDTVLAFPSAGFNCIRFWQQYGNVLWLTADRGYRDLGSLVGQGEPLLNLHGSFSMMVNYHALSEYVRLFGGEVVEAGHYQDQLQVLGYLLGEVAQGGVETRLAFEAAVVNGGPDDYFGLRQALQGQVEGMSLAQVLSFIRWSRFDADVLRDCWEVLVTRVKEADEAWYGDVAAVLEAVQEQYLPLGERDDLEDIAQELWAYLEG